MRKTIRVTLFVIMIPLLFFPSPRAAAQTTGAITGSSTFDTTGFPQWAKDLRRWDIVAFGAFPFAMFATTFAMDTRRWIDANSMDFSEEGRRYAPWPFKSAGAVGMTKEEQETTIIIAAGISVAVAVADFVIVQIKRQKERQRAESIQAGNVIINKSPWPEGGAAADSGADATGTDGDAAGTPGGETAPEAPAAP